MKESQFLLIKLAEECNEVAQMALKCVQFGMDDLYKERSNRSRIDEEIMHLETILRMLRGLGVVATESSEIDIVNKESVVRRWMEYSKQRGILESTYNMSLEEAKMFLDNGGRLCHHCFARGEFVEKIDGSLFDRDGVEILEETFWWSHRNLLDGWEKYDS